jgi:hypothetical protein
LFRTRPTLNAQIIHHGLGLIRIEDWNGKSMVTLTRASIFGVKQHVSIPSPQPGIKSIWHSSNMLGLSSAGSTTISLPQLTAFHKISSTSEVGCVMPSTQTDSADSVSSLVKAWSLTFCRHSLLCDNKSDV